MDRCRWGAAAAVVTGGFICAAGGCEAAAAALDIGGAAAEPAAEADFEETATAAESCTTKWTSTDPGVADLANAIEQRYPGHVVAVNGVRNGVEIDIETQNAIIEVKANNGSGIARQVINRLQFGKSVIGYAPKMGPFAAQSINKAGGIASGGVASTLEDLLNILKP